MNHKLKIIIFLLLVIFLSGCILEDSMVRFCRRTFAGLIQGNSALENNIDWGNFQAMEVNVGETYMLLPDSKERRDYKKAFFKSVAAGFRQTGGSYKLFVNWYVFDKDGDKVIVTADYKKTNKTIFFTVSKTPRPKLISLQWDKP